MISDKIEKRRQHYLEFIYSSNRTIARVNPNVRKVDIDYMIHWYELPSMSAHHNVILSSDSSVIVHEWCPNKDCTSNGFDLSGILTTMLVQNRTEENGTIKCDRCSAKLDYSIKIEYAI